MRRPPGRMCASTFAVLCLASVISSADNASPETAPGASSPPSPSTVVLPAVSFRGDPAANELFDALRAAPAFANLSKEAPGAPIQLRVYHSARPSKMDAKNFFSGLASVGTLGLSPVIMSGEYTMHYEIYVNGQRISHHDYSTKLSLSESLNGKAADPTHGLGVDGVLWARSTVDLFVRDIANDDSVRQLGEEYQTYFGVGTPSDNKSSAGP
jgi:hypothetical protein